MIRLFLITLLLVVPVSAQSGVETGEINGAQFRIDIPENWTGELLVYCHGYSPNPGSFDNPRVMERLAPFLGMGFAVAQSGYATGGWAIAEAVQDTEAVRRYFIQKHGKPKRTYVTGHSMGGFLTMTLLEEFPDAYDGGLALCGPLAAANWFMARRVFDLVVVFDYFFPVALPPLDRVPPSFVTTPEVTATLLEKLSADVAKAAEVRQWSGIRNDKELAATVAFFTYIVMDLQQRGGGHPFDNRDIIYDIYDGVSDDNALNQGVKRFAANPRAAQYLRTYYTPSGRLERPMLAIHTTYDALVPPWVPNRYETLAETAGNAGLFVQQYVRRAGHCAIPGRRPPRGCGSSRRGSRTARPRKLATLRSSSGLPYQGRPRGWMTKPGPVYTDNRREPGIGSREIGIGDPGMLRQFRPPVRALALALCFVFVCPSAAPASTLPPSSTASEPSESLPSNCPPPEVRITESEMNAQGNSTASDPASGCATGSAQLLDDEELAQLAARAEEPGAEVVGGALTNQQLTYIVIALATAVIVLIAK